MSDVLKQDIVRNLGKRARKGYWNGVIDHVVCARTPGPILHLHNS